MKKYCLYILICLHSHLLFGQLRITTGTHWVNQGGSNIVLENLNLINDGNLVPGASLIKFSGNVNSTISGSTITNFNELGIVKTGSNKLILGQNITVEKRVIFITGLLELNQRELGLGPTAYLFNESEASRIIGLSGGEVSITLPMNAPVASNPGNLGAVISTGVDMGSVNIRRGHKTQAGTGLPGSINRYFSISPTNNAGLNADFRAYYFDAELNNQAENGLNFFQSNNNGISWTNQSAGTRNSIQNFVEKPGVNDFSRWTLSSSASGGGPDLTCSQIFSSSQINPGTSIDLVLVIRNIGLQPTSAPIDFSITTYLPIGGLSVELNNAISVMLEVPIILNNNDWVFNPQTGAFTSKPNVFISPGANSVIGVKIIRAGGAAGSVNQTTTIVPGTGGGDTNSLNNSLNNIIYKN